MIEIFDKYGLKCTFNMNFSKFGEWSQLVCDGKQIAHVKPSAHEIADMYRNHEVAGHTLDPPFLPDLDEKNFSFKPW